MIYIFYEYSVLDFNEKIKKIYIFNKKILMLECTDRIVVTLWRLKLIDNYTFKQSRGKINTMHKLCSNEIFLYKNRLLDNR